MTLRIAPTLRIEELGAEVDEILEAIGTVRGLKDIWVSDRSSLLEFNQETESPNLS